MSYIKKACFSALLLLISFQTFSQQGTVFCTGSLKENLEKAGKENKLVFLDAYTSWCAPCKMMDTKIFPRQEVGEMMHAHFIPVKYDMEKGEGVDIARQYEVDIYPTFLILQADGTIWHKLIGAFATPEDFIAKINEVVDPNRAYGPLTAQYEAGNRNLSVMRNYIYALLDVRDNEKAGNVAKELLASLDKEEVISEAYWFIFEDDRLSPMGSANLDFVLANLDLFYENVGAEKVNGKLAGTFEKKLENILIGRDKQSPLQEVLLLKEYIEPYEFPGKETLLGYADMIRAQKSGEIGTMLELAEKIFPGMPEDKLNQIYFSVAFSIRKEADKKQQKRLLELSRKLYAEAEEDGRFKSALGRFIKTELGEKMTTGVKK